MSEKMPAKKFDLEDRLIDFAVMVVSICENMRKTYASKHLAKQLVRSGTSPGLNYGEAMSGESRKDFVHKLKIALKELRETYICMKIIKRSELCKAQEVLSKAISENNELISIFVKSVETAQKNMKLENNHSKF